MSKNPTWHTDEDNSTWDRIKAAMKNDWEQTKNDFGSDKARDMDQDVDDTIKQAFNADDAFENREQALRFGVAARRQFGNVHSTWNNDLDNQLRSDYPGDYDADRGHIRYGYDYKH